MPSKPTLPILICLYLFNIAPEWYVHSKEMFKDTLNRFCRHNKGKTGGVS